MGVAREGAAALRWNDVVALARRGNVAPPRRVEKTDEEWRAELTDEQYHVARRKGTERPFSSELCALFEPGRYSCICCGTPLFDSTSKFDSGTGWPSFTRPLTPDVVAYHLDSSHGMQRVETTCNVCDAHLGHVFPDGPQPSGLRFCINAVSLRKTTAATADS
ncbi:MAG TPA: peptide-methionine (R)-S-oxide reductase MsrB [Gammaproteobacteria bacterium]|nr:peptide-methionine (R)-S-oxide reductase MsrB [Gammaproteobacteria bacterium]